MHDTTYKIVNVLEKENVITITYICNNDPIPYNLFQCSFSIEDNQYSIHELLHYCMRTEDFHDISGLYSSEFEQKIVGSLHHQILNQFNSLS
jgi:hypothetical protein